MLKHFKTGPSAMKTKKKILTNIHMEVGISKESINKELKGNQSIKITSRTGKLPNLSSARRTSVSFVYVLVL